MCTSHAVMEGQQYNNPLNLHYFVPMSLCREAQASMSVPNLKQIALFVQKLLGVPKFRNWVT